MRLRVATLWMAVAAVCLTLSPGCRPKDLASPVYDMGEKVQVGPLIYHVIETEWKSQLGDSLDARTPERNFLIVRLAVTNSGGEAILIPQLKVQNSQGDLFPESSDGKGVDQWLGMLRELKPGSTEEGHILFDVPLNSYRLKVADAGESDDSAKFAFIKLPLSFDSGQGIPGQQ